MPNKNKYNLEERTTMFSEKMVKFLLKVPKNVVTVPIITQLVKCITSIGANYCEADDAESKSDFKHKIGICKKESREATYFLRILTVAVPEFKEEISINWQEAKELNLIFNAIFKKVK